MSDPNRTVTPEELGQLQRKFSEIKHSINNALAVMMALSEMSQRRPDYAEKLASTVLTKAPQIVSSLQEFTQALNEKTGVKPEGVAGEYKKNGRKKRLPTDGGPRKKIPIVEDARDGRDAVPPH